MLLLRSATSRSVARNSGRQFITTRIAPVLQAAPVRLIGDSAVDLVAVLAHRHQLGLPHCLCLVHVQPVRASRHRRRRRRPMPPRQ
jgi:hypothetical protein